MPARCPSHKRWPALGLGATLLWACFAHAAAPVEDRSATGNVNNSPRLADLFYQMQQMQQEIMELRGQLEEQSYRVRRLEKQRLEDYQLLDKRLQQGTRSRSSSTGITSVKPGSGKAAAAAGTTAIATTAKPKTATGAAAAPKPASTERDAYKAAYQLLKQQQLKEAKMAFSDFLQQYPDGQYTSNAYYWLGELYLTDDNLSQAKKNFSILLDRYPNYRKTPDSTFKLAKIYYQEGEKTKAKQLLNKIIADYGDSSPSTVKLATAYLDKYYR